MSTPARASTIIQRNKPQPPPTAACTEKSRLFPKGAGGFFIAAGTSASAVVVAVEFGSGGDAGDLRAFLPLAGDVARDEFLREHPALGKVGVVLLQGVQRPFEARRQAAELGLLLIRQGEEIEVVRPPAVLFRIDLFLHAVKTGHEQGRVAEIRVAGRIGVADLEAAQLRRFRVSRDADDRAAVRGGVADRDRGFKTRDQALEGVGAGVRDRA